ncbi:MAG: RHS repeat-associated core domain-containing protein, partial [Pseudomonadota bacterium]
NAMGELMCQIDANRNVTVNEYDDFGRMVIQRQFYLDMNTNIPDLLDATGLDCAALRLSIPSSATHLESFYYPYAIDSASRNGDEGQLERQTYTEPAAIAGGGLFTVIYEFEYDNYGRLNRSDTEIRESSHSFYYFEATRYDKFGRVLVQFDASGGSRGDAFKYTPTGHLLSVHDARYRLDDAGNPALFTTHQVDASGRMLHATLGNGIELQRTYDPATGEIILRGDYDLSGINRYITLFDHHWDDIGNLVWRADLASASPSYEYYYYDDGGISGHPSTGRRLTDVIVSDDFSAPISRTQLSANEYALQRIRYDEVGNITCKSDLPGGDSGNCAGAHAGYSYGPANNQPHAVRTTGGGLLARSYVYDDNGNLTARTHNGITELEIEYTVFNKAASICNGLCNSGVAQTHYGYGPGRARAIKWDQTDATMVRTHYVGAVEFEYNGPLSSAHTQQNQGAPTFDVARRPFAGVGLQRLERFDGNQIVQQTHYRHTDHQGSLLALTNTFGQIVMSGSNQAQLRYDPWGQRRSSYQAQAPAWQQWVSTTTPIWAVAMLEYTPRGYTGHEHLDDHGLINMNGRLFDPLLGRFMQADPFMEDTGTLNRYTYVHNNPLAYTDPTGYSSWKDWVKVGAAIAIGAVTQNWAWAAENVLAAIAIGAAGGAVAGAISTGTWDGALAGAFTGGVFAGMGNYLSNAAWSSQLKAGSDTIRELNTIGRATQITTNAVASGIGSEIQGGKFGNGFVTAAISSTVGGEAINAGGSTEMQFVLSVLVGGTVSELSGGKFANGAVTAAMAFSFGQLGRSGPKRLHGGATSTTGTLSEDQIRSVWQKMREYPEIAAIEAEKGEFVLTVDASKVTGYYSDGHTININPGTFGMEFETVMHAGFEESIAHLPDDQWFAAMDAYPSHYPFSAERVLFHEAMHATQSSSGLRYSINPGAYEMPVIRQTNEFMFRNYGEPFRKDHTSVRPRN